MKIKLLAAAAAVALSALSGSAHAAGETWTVMATGHITSGIDYSGVFGTAGQSLTGLAYTQTITASVDPSLWDVNDPGDSFNYLHSVGPAFTDTVTVNGHTLTLNPSSTDFGGQFITSDASLGGVVHSYFDGIKTFQSSWLPGGGSIDVSIQAFSYRNAFVPTLYFGQSIVKNIEDASFTASSYFTLTGNQHAEFVGDVTVISVNAVPEPETYAMLLAGLGLVVLASRRKSKV